MEQYFVYGQAETNALSARDPALGAVIARIGHIDRVVTPALFAALVESIAGQQISSRAQATVCARLRACIGVLTPQAVAKQTPEALRACGISLRKAHWLLAAAQAAQDGTVNFEALTSLPDEAVCQALCALPGVGRWTAEMLLLFSLQRPDVLSYGDFGIRRGLCLLHGHETLSREQFAHYRALYTPYGSVASFYLWALAAGQ